MERLCKGGCGRKKPLNSDNFDSAGNGRYRHECKKCRSDIEKLRRVQKKQKNKKALAELKSRLQYIRACKRDGISIKYKSSEFKICIKRDCVHKGKPQPIDNFTTCIISKDLLRNYCNSCIAKKHS